MSWDQRRKVLFSSSVLTKRSGVRGRADMAGGLETTSTLDFKVDEGLTSEVNNGLGGVSPEMDQQLHGEWRNLENTEY